jgi:hypothetical protein
MYIGFRFLGLASAVSMLMGLGSMTGCTSDDDSNNGGAGGTGGAAPGGAGGTTVPTGGGGSTTTSSALACPKLTVLDGTKPGIADFDTYDGASDLSTWSFAMGGDSSTGIFAGTFGYGDRANNKPETFDMATGHASLYGLRVKDSMAVAWGGGMGIWMSGCLDVRKFTGIQFWVRGNAPDGTAKFSVLMKETTPVTPAQAGNKTGTCQGIAEKTCIHPFKKFEVTADWKLIQVPWTGFDAGDAAGTPVVANGSNIWQIQYDIGLSWMPDASGAYVPVPSAYELEIDTIAFY